MEIRLKRAFAGNSEVDEFDVRQIKHALNRLGYYVPYEKLGMTGIPDREVFDALKNFQKDNGLWATGECRPGDETVNALNSRIAEKPDGFYIWRSVGDDKVRDSHAAYNGTIRSWADSPDPTEEYNCRCWAENLDELNVEINCGELKHNLDVQRMILDDYMNEIREADRKAKKLSIQLDVAWKKLRTEMVKAGFEVSSSFIPGINGNIPLIEPVLEAAKSAIEVRRAYREYSRIWDVLSQTIKTQEFFQKMAEDQRKKVDNISQELEKLGCAS